MGSHWHVLSAAEMRKTALVSWELRALAGEGQEEWSRKGDKDVANKKGSRFMISIESLCIKRQEALLPSPRLVASLILY